MVLLVGAVFTSTAGWTPTAHAQSLDSAGSPVNPDVSGDERSERYAIDRTWLFADDARVPAPLVVVAMASTSYTDVGPSPFNVGGVTIPTRYHAFDLNTAQPGFLMSAGGEIGLVPRLSVVASGQLVVGGETSHANGGAVAGLRFQATPTAWQHLHVVVSAGYLREAWEGPVFDDDANKWVAGNPDGDNGAWFQGAISGDLGRLRLVGNFHGEHIFANGRDPLDIMVDLGATYRLVGQLRAGVEWVGQDLEETFSPGAEGGARMFAGPIASYQLDSSRITIVGGPALGVSQTTGSAPNFIGRIGAAYGF